MGVVLSENLKFPKIIFINVLIFVIVLLFVEIIFIFCEPVYIKDFFIPLKQTIPMEKDREFPDAGYRLVPNRRGTTLGKEVSINSLGFRDQEYEIKTDAYRVIGIGDSVCFGWGVEFKDAYLKKFEQRLNNYYSEGSVEVLNLGVPGTNTVNQCHLLENRFLHLKPNLVLVNFFLNDSELEGEFSFEPDKVVPLSSYFKYSALGRRIIFSLYHGFVVEKGEQYLKKSFDDKYPGWLAFKDAARQLKFLSEKQQFRLIFVLVPIATNYLDNPILSKMTKKVASVLRTESIEYIDIVELISDKNLGSMKISERDFHPNEKLHEIIANKLLQYFKIRDIIFL